MLPRGKEAMATPNEQQASESIMDRSMLIATPAPGVEIRYVPLVGDALVHVADLCSVLGLEGPPPAFAVHVIVLPPYEFVKRSALTTLLAGMAEPAAAQVADMISSGLFGAPVAQSEPKQPACNPLREVVTCPGCGKQMKFHALAYRHRCAPSPASKRRKRIAALDARVAARIQPRAVETRAVGSA